MKRREQALLFLRKAAEDEALLDEVLESDRVSDATIGFHCQQAAEKLLKALLSEIGADFRRTHDLTELGDLLADAGHPLPHELAEVDALTPYAVDLPPRGRRHLHAARPPRDSPNCSAPSGTMWRAKSRLDPGCSDRERKQRQRLSPRGELEHSLRRIAREANRLSQPEPFHSRPGQQWPGRFFAAAATPPASPVSTAPPAAP